MSPRSVVNPKKAKEAKDAKQPKQPKEPKVPKEKKEPKQRKTSKQPKSTEARECFACEPKRLDFLEEKVKSIKIKANPVLHPAMVYADRGPLVIYLCYECRLFNALRPTKDVGSGKVQLPLGMCTICRTHLNRQRAVKFHHHEVPIIKKQYSL
ncbi:unnamed protein product [Caenorhabditis nigoni]